MILELFPQPTGRTCMLRVAPERVTLSLLWEGTEPFIGGYWLQPILHSTTAGGRQGYPPVHAAAPSCR